MSFFKVAGPNGKPPPPPELLPDPLNDHRATAHNPLCPAVFSSLVFPPLKIPPPELELALRPLLLPKPIPAMNPPESGVSRSPPAPLKKAASSDKGICILTQSRGKRPFVWVIGCQPRAHSPLYSGGKLTFVIVVLGTSSRRGVVGGSSPGLLGSVVLGLGLDGGARLCVEVIRTEGIWIGAWDDGWDWELESSSDSCSTGIKPSESGTVGILTVVSLVYSE